MKKSTITLPALLLVLLSAELFAATTFTLPPRTFGPKNAPITIEIYSDFQCPFCREYYLSTLSRLIEDYCKKTGKVYLVHRDLPFPMHPYALPAARWANAAATVGKYEAVSEALYQKQNDWTKAGDIEPVIASVMTPAQLKQVKDVMEKRKAEIDAAIQTDVNMAKAENMTNIPTTKIFHKGKMVNETKGGISYAVLKKFIDEELKK